MSPQEGYMKPKAWQFQDYKWTNAWTNCMANYAKFENKHYLDIASVADYRTVKTNDSTTLQVVWDGTHVYSIFSVFKSYLIAHAVEKFHNVKK